MTGRFRFPQTGAFSYFRVLPALLCMLVLAVMVLFAGAVRGEEEFLHPEEAFRFSAAMAGPVTVDVHFRIAPKYYMYRDRFVLEAPEGVVEGATYPPGLVKYDPTFEQDMEVYYGQVTVRIHLSDPAPPSFPAGKSVTLAVTSQGCADAGLCYPPDTRELHLTPDAQGSWTLSGDAVVKTVPAPLAMALGGDGNPLEGGSLNPLDFGDTGLADWLHGAPFYQVVGLCLLLGLMLAFTPCVLPMVPILMAVIAGQSQKGAGVSRGRGLSLAAAFVLGMSIVYTVLGIIAGLLGAGLMIWLQTPWVLVSFAVLLALLALPMFDVFTLQAPAALQTVLNERMNRLPGGRYGGVFLMGMLSALIVGPCVAAPLAGVLLFISQSGDVVLGGSALFALAWGSGIPLLLLGASSGALLPRAGAWMVGVKWAFGLLLLATAWWMVGSLVPAWVVMLGWVVLAMTGGVMMGAFESLPAGAGAGRRLWKALGLLLSLWAALMLVGVAGGGHDPFRPLAPYVGGNGIVEGAPGAAERSAAVKQRFVKVDSVDELDALLAQADRPVMLDFYADWCVSCIEMERFTFSDPDVARKLENMILVQADVTPNTAEHRALLKRFRLFGPPGIIFFDARGRELDTRVVGFQNAERFARSLDEVFTKAAENRALPEAPPGAPAEAAAARQVPPSSSLLSQQLRGLDGEVGQNPVATRALERQQ